jgi:predicted nucleic acid-binding protein
MLIALGVNCTLEDTVKLPMEIEMSRVSTSDTLPSCTSEQHEELDSCSDDTPRSDASGNDMPKLWESMTTISQDIHERSHHQCEDDLVVEKCNNTLVQPELQTTDEQPQSNHIDAVLNYFNITETRLLSILKGYLKKSNHYLQSKDDHEILIKWFAKEGAQHSRIRILIKEICKKQKIAQPSNINNLVKTIQSSFQGKSVYPILRRQSTFEIIKDRVNITARRMSDGFRAFKETSPTITPVLNTPPMPAHSTPLSNRAVLSMHFNCISNYFHRKVSSAITKIQDFFIKANRQ